MREKICFFLLPSENRRRKFVQLIEGTFVSKKEIFSSSLQRVFIKLPKNYFYSCKSKNYNEEICFFLIPSENRRGKFVQLIAGTFVSEEEEEICFSFFEEYKKKKNL